jgi:phosphatidate cytidylyltransferase
MQKASLNPDLPRRLKTALALILILVISGIAAVYSLWGARFFAFLALAVVLAATYEYISVTASFRLAYLAIMSRLVNMSLLLILPIVTFLGAIFTYPISSLQTITSYYLVGVFLALVLLVWFVCIQSTQTGSVGDIGTFCKNCLSELLAFLLLSVGGGALILLALTSPGKLLFLIFFVAIADTSAYFAGRKFGGPKISPIVSPGKTIVGTVTAVVATGLVSAMSACVLISCSGFTNALLLGFAVAFASQSGDFSKSIIKRLYNVKDFSNLLPGHGGFFDRIDGILGSAPLFLIAVQFWI